MHIIFDYINLLHIWDSLTKILQMRSFIPKCGNGKWEFSGVFIEFVLCIKFIEVIVLFHGHGRRGVTCSGEELITYIITEYSVNDPF